MRDRYFFPLAATLAGVFVFMALQPYADRCPTGPVSGGGRNAEDVTVKGREFCRVVIGQSKENEIDVVTPKEGGEQVLSITRQAGADYGDPRIGPHLVLAEDLENAFESRPIEVVIEARASGDFPASRFEANYFARTESESGWQGFDLTPQFQEYTLKFHAPKRGATEGYDYVGFRPVVPDKQRTMEVRSVRVRSVGDKSTPPASPTGPMP